MKLETGSPAACCLLPTVHFSFTLHFTSLSSLCFPLSLFCFVFSALCFALSLRFLLSHFKDFFVGHPALHMCDNYPTCTNVEGASTRLDSGGVEGRLVMTLNEL